MDRLTKHQRSKLMAQVRPKGSRIEMLLRRRLWQEGFRYRLHAKNLPGTPDLVFIGAKVAVFVDSEFWHGHDWERRKHDFKSNTKFWFAKIERNMERDREVDELLRQQGWTPLRFWGKDIQRDMESCVSQLRDALMPKRS